MLKVFGYKIANNTRNDKQYLITNKILFKNIKETIKKEEIDEKNKKDTKIKDKKPTEEAEKKVEDDADYY